MVIDHIVVVVVVCEERTMDIYFQKYLYISTCKDES